jgi:hypothetical protein
MTDNRAKIILVGYYKRHSQVGFGTKIKNKRFPTSNSETFI